MKSPGLAPHLLAATLFLGSAGVAADAAPGLEGFRARMLELFDENKDGRLDTAEQAKARKYAEELGFVPDGPLRRQLMQRFDKNGNGKIDDDEQAAVRESMRQRMAGNPPATATPTPLPEPPVPETADPAKLALERTIRAALATDPVQLKRFDRDGDGQISHAEWAMARREIQDVLGDGLVLAAMATEEEEKKMKAVIEEVARRRRENETGVKVQTLPADEQRRLEAVRKEIDRRRGLRTRAEQQLEAVKDVPPESKKSDPVAGEIAEGRTQRQAGGEGKAPTVKSTDETQRQAELLVKDLLEVGMAQRHAYEEAQRRAAEPEKSKAEAPPRK